MKYIEKCFYLLIMIGPQILSEYYQQEWQTRAVYLIGSVAIILLFNIDSYEIFQISRDGVQIKKILSEAKNTAIDLKTMLETTLLLQTKQLIITGGTPEQITEQYDIISKAVISNDLKNEELLKEVEILKNKCLKSFISELGNCLNHMSDTKEVESGYLSGKMLNIIRRSYYEIESYPTPKELNDALSELKIAQSEYLKSFPMHSRSYYDMYYSAEIYIDKYQEFYDKLK